MDIQTRQRFDAYSARIAALNGVTSAAQAFAVAPAIGQRLEEKLKETFEFLAQINIENPLQIEGQVLSLESTRSIAGRVDTSGGTRRNPTDPTDNGESNRYSCRQTNFDWSRSYFKMDAWRHKPDFENLLMMAILKQYGRDLLKCGWNGTSRADNVDPAVDTMLATLAEGWLHKIRTRAPAQRVNDGDLTSGATKAIYVQSGVEPVNADASNTGTARADYSSLDALVLDLKRLIPEWHRGDTGLVAIVGHNLLDDKYFNIAQTTGTTATEVEATDRILRSKETLGGLPAIRTSYFPGNAVLITRLNNLSIYNQDGTRRRRLADEPEYDRVANYESVNMDYVVEDYQLVALAENIVLGAKP